MKILVANLGSTSFKYRLFDVSDPAEPVLARVAIERIGRPFGISCVGHEAACRYAVMERLQPATPAAI